MAKAAWTDGYRGLVPQSGLQVLKKTYSSRPTRHIVWKLRDREVACSASDAVSSHSSHHSQAVLLAKFSLYVHRSGPKPHSFHFRQNSVL